MFFPEKKTTTHKHIQQSQLTLKLTNRFYLLKLLSSWLLHFYKTMDIVLHLPKVFLIWPFFHLSKINVTLFDYD